jgi:hypothetical protein
MVVLSMKAEHIVHRHAKSDMPLLTNPVTIVVLTSAYTILALDCWSNFLSNGKSLTLVIFSHHIVHFLYFHAPQSATTTPINGSMSIDSWILSSHSMSKYHYRFEKLIDCGFAVDVHLRILISCVTELIWTIATRYANKALISQNSPSLG